jgi:predicted nucleic acid-binding protein
MILVDTSVIVAWLDRSHTHHEACKKALEYWAGHDQLAVSSITYAELAAGARVPESIDEALSAFQRIDLDFPTAWRAGQAFRQHRPHDKDDVPVLPDFFIRAQSAVLSMPHLTNDHRRIGNWPDVDFLFPVPA